MENKTKKTKSSDSKKKRNILLGVLIPVGVIGITLGTVLPIVMCKGKNKEESKLTETDHDTWIQRYASFVTNYDNGAPKYLTAKIGGNKIYYDNKTNRPCIMDYHEIGGATAGKKYALIDSYFGEQVIAFGGFEKEYIEYFIQMWTDQEKGWYTDLKYYMSDDKVELKATLKTQYVPVGYPNLHVVWDKNSYMTTAQFLFGDSNPSVFDCTVEYSNDTCESLSFMKKYNELYDNAALAKDKYTTGVKVSGWLINETHPEPTSFIDLDATMLYYQIGTSTKYGSKASINISGLGKEDIETSGFRKYGDDEGQESTSIQKKLQFAERWAQLDPEVQVTYKADSNGLSIQTKKGEDIIYKLELNKDLYVTYELFSGVPLDTKKQYEVTITYPGA